MLSNKTFVGEILLLVVIARRAPWVVSCACEMRQKEPFVLLGCCTDLVLEVWIDFLLREASNVSVVTILISC